MRILIAAALLAACQTTSGTNAQAALAGDWRLLDVNGTPVVGDSTNRPTLRFEADSGRVGGNFGCNRGGGSFTIGADGSLRFSAIAMTRRACIDERMNVQETALAAALGATDGYRLSADTLELRQAERILARFVK